MVNAMFNWFSGNKNSQLEEKEHSNTATQRLQSYISAQEDDVDTSEDVSNNKSHLIKPIITQRKEILNQSQQAIDAAKKIIYSNHSELNRDDVLLSHGQPLPGKASITSHQYINDSVNVDEHHQSLDVDDIDYSDADMSIIMANLEEDPFQETEELLDSHRGKKYVDVIVVYDEQNTIAQSIYRFETPSFTTFYEKWTEELYRLGTFTQQDVNGRLVTINPSKCYTVEIRKFVKVEKTFDDYKKNRRESPLL